MYEKMQPYWPLFLKGIRNAFIYVMLLPHERFFLSWPIPVIICKAFESLVEDQLCYANI